MKRLTVFLLCMAAMVSFSSADLQMPPKPNFYDKLGQGLANIVLSPTEVFDSTYGLLQTEGPTVGATKGFVQGTSRMIMDIFVGAYQIVTSPLPTPDIKQPAYDTGQVNPYPPSDLLDNWY